MSRAERGSTVGFVVVVVLAVVTAGAVGVAGAQTNGSQSTDAYSIRQDGQCATITPLTGNDSAKEFYAYNLPYPDNPYATGLNESYSSEGTTDLQQNRTSLLFLHQSADGNLSLVMVHGTKGEGTDGGAASFEITGLPADGAWTVKDDDYNNSHNYDRWNHTNTTAAVDWTWGGNATDGGVYAGLGDDFRVTIDPAFNEEAALYGQHYNGTVEDWQALSGERTDPDRISLDRTEPVIISTEPCDDSTTAPPAGVEDDDDDRDAGRDRPNERTETTEDETETPERPERTETETETTEGETTDADTETPEEETTERETTAADGTETAEDETETPEEGTEVTEEDTTETEQTDDGTGPADDETGTADGQTDTTADDEPTGDGGATNGQAGQSDGDPFDEIDAFDEGGPFGGDGPFDGDGPFGEEPPFDRNETER